MSSRTKKVHYERGTKAGSHRNSRDSGFGSASDHASSKTRVDDTTSSFPNLHQSHDIDARHALQEALDSAYDTINQLKSDNQKLSSSLAESNKENRQLKKEKGVLLDRVEELLLDLKEERKANQKLTRETSSRSATTTPPPVDNLRIRSAGSRRASLVYDIPPLAPPPPPNHSAPLKTRVPPPNPFAPLKTRVPPPEIYALSPTQPYPPTTETYTAGPIYASISPVSTRSHYSSSTTSSSKSSHNDGKYHLTPL